VFKEFVKEEAHLFVRDHVGVQCKDPVTSVHLYCEALVHEVSKQCRQMFLHKMFKQLTMLVKSRQLRLVDVTQLVVFDQGHEEPESNFFGAMEQEGADNEIHALDIANVAVILGKRGKYFAKGLLALARRVLEDIRMGERP